MNNLKERISWNDYFMTMCFLVAQRSLDPATKHGAVCLDQSNTILSIGYNSPPRGSNDLIVPLTRPEKYPWFLHAEEALICNAAKNGIKLDGSKIFISGFPCSGCIRKIINSGIKEIIYGPKNSNMVNETEKNIVFDMLRYQKVKFKYYCPKFNKFEIFIK